VNYKVADCNDDGQLIITCTGILFYRSLWIFICPLNGTTILQYILSKTLISASRALQHCRTCQTQITLYWLQAERLYYTWTTKTVVWSLWTAPIFGTSTCCQACTLL